MARTTGPHLACSARTKAANSSGVEGEGSAFWLSNCFFTSRNYRTLRSFTMPSQVTAREVFRHHSDGWPRDFFTQLAVVLDVFSRRVIGWAMGETEDEELVTLALHQHVLVFESEALADEVRSAGDDDCPHASRSLSSGCAGGGSDRNRRCGSPAAHRQGDLDPTAFAWVPRGTGRIADGDPTALASPAGRPASA